MGLALEGVLFAVFGQDFDGVLHDDHERDEGEQVGHSAVLLEEVQVVDHDQGGQDHHAHQEVPVTRIRLVCRLEHDLEEFCEEYDVTGAHSDLYDH